MYIKVHRCFPKKTSKAKIKKYLIECANDKFFIQHVDSEEQKEHIKSLPINKLVNLANQHGFPFALDQNPITCGTFQTKNDNPLTGYRYIAFAGKTATETTSETILSGHGCHPLLRY